MKKIFLMIFAVLCSVLLFSCASGSSLVTGTKRPATDPESVVIYTEAPANYEVIGIVKAKSDAGLTDQGSLNFAVKELKKQAAKIGANGVIIENVGSSSSGGVLIGNVIVNEEYQNVSGKAIYVER